ncbi:MULTISPECIES: pilus assembly protein PilW [unclassified Pseudomonas]|uniref:pilus assembly protein PilW n=1 Tax=unclassified Pseudomonas TaxID=196821 RepID=UPI00244B1DC5|nr:MULTISPECIES: pilus assembly protein PilW [unclassified Pseudomonas]MDH0304682.1 pilus assembly protein PilW [Pseudomonas sp. GD04091]MDH1986943.1 pilus assembly protein PilW [Pseudomonas sp. GD03689]
MTRRQAGFGLMEALLALTLGAMLLAVTGQVFVSAHQAWRLQGASARLQDDARLAMQRLVEDIRQAGMFGCLRLEASDFDDPATAQAFARPIEITDDGLTLIGAELPGLLGAPDWTVLTDCRTWARVQRGQHVGEGEWLALPVRRVSYRVRNGSLMLTSNAQHAALVDNVRALEVRRVQEREGERLDIRLSLFDRQHQLEQQHAVSVAVRNGGAGS